MDGRASLGGTLRLESELRCSRSFSTLRLPRESCHKWRKGGHGHTSPDSSRQVDGSWLGFHCLTVPSVRGAVRVCVGECRLSDVLLWTRRDYACRLQTSAHKRAIRMTTVYKLLGNSTTLMCDCGFLLCWVGTHPPLSEWHWGPCNTLRRCTRCLAPRTA
jgi:hypothetical protein